MKLLATACLALAASVGLAFAGGPVVVAPEPEPISAAPAAAVHDWSGFYAGLSYGKTSADIAFTPGISFDFEDGSVAGLYAGYLFQRGAFVYGGELAYGKVRETFLPGFNGDDEIGHVLDLKARAGLAANRALFYGVLGYSQSTYVEPPLLEFDLDGLVYGLGAEYAVTPRLSVGLEYLSRDLSGTATGGVAIEADTRVDTLSLRVGLSF